MRKFSRTSAFGADPPGGTAALTGISQFGPVVAAERRFLAVPQRQLLAFSPAVHSAVSISPLLPFSRIFSTRWLQLCSC